MDSASSSSQMIWPLLIRVQPVEASPFRQVHCIPLYGGKTTECGFARPRFLFCVQCPSTNMHYRNARNASRNDNVTASQVGSP